MNCAALSPVSQNVLTKNPQKLRFFSEEQLACLSPALIPRHIAIIPDGNRRWALKQNSTHREGHIEGADIVIDTVKAAKELGVQMVTIYAFSTENWKRPQEEVDVLMWLIENYLIAQKNLMIDEEIRLQTIGDTSQLPPSLRRTIADTKKATAACNAITLVLAINYGGRNEITRAMQQILEEIERGKLTREAVNEETISRYLDTSKWRDPDLLIRTSGEMRISNFLIWQLTYSEIYVADILWPDFRPQHLFDAVVEYQIRERRLGN